MDELQTNEDTQYLPAVNTYIDQSTPGYTPPFNHFQRLADKLVGAVEINLDNAVAQAKLQKARDDAAIRMVQAPVGFLPQSLGSWLQRNSGMIFTLVILGMIFFLGSLALKK